MDNILNIEEHNGVITSIVDSVNDINALRDNLQRLTQNYELIQAERNKQIEEFNALNDKYNVLEENYTELKKENLRMFLSTGTTVPAEDEEETMTYDNLFTVE